MIESKVKLAENDVRFSPGVRVIGRLERIREKDEKKGNKRREVTLIAVGSEFDRGEHWNDYVSRNSFTGDSGNVSFQRHSAFDRTEEGTSVLEVILFDNSLHAEKVYENLEQAERNKLEIVER